MTSSASSARLHRLHVAEAHGPVRVAGRAIRWATVGLALCNCSPSLAGGGGATQTAPDTVRAGEPAVVELRLSVWGSGARIAGQYRDVALLYRLVGTSAFQRAPEPRRTVVDERHETYAFTIPPYPAGTAGSIEFYFTATLNGRTTQIRGTKQIRVE